MHYIDGLISVCPKSYIGTRNQRAGQGEYAFARAWLDQGSERNHQRHWRAKTRTKDDAIKLVKEISTANTDAEAIEILRSIVGGGPDLMGISFLEDGEGNEYYRMGWGGGCNNLPLDGTAYHEFEWPSFKWPSYRFFIVFAIVISILLALLGIR